jgi:hypothetical protein
VFNAWGEVREVTVIESLLLKCARWMEWSGFLEARKIRSVRPLDRPGYQRHRAHIAFLVAVRRPTVPVCEFTPI